MLASCKQIDKLNWWEYLNGSLSRWFKRVEYNLIFYIIANGTVLTVKLWVNICFDSPLAFSVCSIIKYPNICLETRAQSQQVQFCHSQLLDTKNQLEWNICENITWQGSSSLLFHTVTRQTCIWDCKKRCNVNTNNQSITKTTKTDTHNEN